MFIAFACQCYSKKPAKTGEKNSENLKQQKRVKMCFYKMKQKEKYSRHRFESFLTQVQKLLSDCVSK